jgi:lipopolysaccharide transport system ATP-binding protein
MSDTVIRVENLSKRYVLSHQQEGGYKALRDVLADGAKSLFKPLQGSKLKTQNSPKEEFWALKDVSFEIQQGDRVGIIGRNGAGKSTLLKILSRIVEPTSGNIRIKGRVASLLEVGTGFHPELTGRENIFLNGAILGMSKAEIQRKFDEIVAFAEVEKFLDTPVKRYSSGMYVRLAFAVAAHLEPEILIVDEVLAVGDAKFQKKCLNKMGEVAQEGRTILFVSHNMGAISNLCNKGVFLEKGSVREIGLIDRIATTYLSELFENKIDDLAQLRVPGMGKTTRYSKISLLSEDSSLVFGSPIDFEVRVYSDADVDDLIVGLSIYNNSGNCIGSLLSKQTFSIHSGEEVNVNIRIQNSNLAPGSYYASFGLNQENTQVLFDAVVGKPAFQILPVSDDYTIKNWQSPWGNIYFQDNHFSFTRQNRFSLVDS